MKTSHCRSSAFLLALMVWLGAGSVRAQSVSLAEYRGQTREIARKVEALESHPEQAAKLAALRQRRDNERVRQTLTALERGAAGSENLLPLIIDAVEAYATLGEISDAMRHVFGEQHEFRSTK